jgi:O-succinylbenzoate synthase
MRIWTTQVSSVMLRSKKLEIREKMWQLKELSDENQTEWHEIEPNPSKDRAMSEGDNTSF